MKRPIRLVAPFLLSAVLTSACLPYSYAPCTLPSRLRPGLVHFRGGGDLLHTQNHRKTEKRKLTLS